MLALAAQLVASAGAVSSDNANTLVAPSFKHNDDPRVRCLGSKWTRWGLALASEQAVATNVSKSQDSTQRGGIIPDDDPQHHPGGAIHEACSEGALGRRPNTVQATNARSTDAAGYYHYQVDDTPEKLDVLTLDGQWILSSWTKAQGATPGKALGYLNLMAQEMRETIPTSRTADRTELLLLGLGGGALLGDTLCGGTTSPRPSTARLLNVTAVELDAHMIDVAREQFFPEMFRGCRHAEQRVRIVKGDASTPPQAALGRYAYVAVDFPPIYDTTDGLASSVPFWQRLKALSRAGATLMINTHFYDRQRDANLNDTLTAAGWTLAKELFVDPVSPESANIVAVAKC